MLQDINSVSQWDQLQEPICHSNHSASYLRLLAALDSGWMINCVKLQPVDQQNIPGKYCFILARSDGSELRALQLPQCPELAQFIRNEYLLTCNVSQPCTL